MKYAVITNSTIHHEGDERSRTHLGHGYPAYTETVKTFEEIGDEVALKKWLANRPTYAASYEIVRFEPVKVKTTIDFEIQP